MGKDGIFCLKCDCPGNLILKKYDFISKLCFSFRLRILISISIYWVAILSFNLESSTSAHKNPSEKLQLQIHGFSSEGLKLKVVLVVLFILI